MRNSYFFHGYCHPGLRMWTITAVVIADGPQDTFRQTLSDSLGKLNIVPSGNCIRRGNTISINFLVPANEVVRKNQLVKVIKETVRKHSDSLVTPYPTIEDQLRKSEAIFVPYADIGEEWDYQGVESGEKRVNDGSLHGSKKRSRRGDE